jgi:hypothetical protein
MEVHNVKGNNGFRLSLKGDAFNALASDFDQMLRKTLNTMISKETEEAEITAKVKISLTSGYAPDTEQHAYAAERETFIPKFTHKVTLLMNTKDEKSGFTGGSDYELVWDKDQGDYFMRPIKESGNSSQTSLFESQGADGEDEDAEAEEGTDTTEHFDSQPYESGEEAETDSIIGECVIVQKCNVCCKFCEVREGCEIICQRMDSCPFAKGIAAVEQDAAPEGEPVGDDYGYASPGEDA